MNQHGTQTRRVTDTLCSDPPSTAHDKQIKQGIRPTLAAALLACSACSSSGGYSPPPPSSPPPPPPSPTALYETTEYKAQWGLGAIHASNAYADGLTGDGVTIGVLDLNHILDTARVDYHPDSTGRDQSLIEMTKLIFGELPVQENTDYSHGTWVAEWAAGIKDSKDFHGVAYNAQVLGIDVWSGVNSRDAVVEGIPTTISDPWTWFLDRDVRIANMSLGSSLRITDPNVLNHALYPAEGVSELYLLDSASVFIEGGGIAIFAAGNSSGENPVDPQLSLYDDLSASGALESATGALILVGAVDKNNHIAEFSERAGRTASNFVVAPGADVQYVHDGNVTLANGTSASAPHVSGLAALLMEQSPELIGNEIAEIIFQTAVDLGAPGVDAIFGHGLINVNAAIAPVGPTSVNSVSGAILPVAMTALELPPAFGDALVSGMGFDSVLMHDSFQRTFNAGFSSRIRNAAFDRLSFDGVLRSAREVEGSDIAFGTGQFSVSYLNSRQDIQHLQQALPMSMQNQPQPEMPSVRMAARIDDKINVFGAYGMKTERLLGTNSQHGYFLTAPVLSDNFGGFTRNQRSVGINIQMDDTTDVSFAAAIGDYEINRHVFGLAERPRATSAQMHMNHRKNRLKIGFSMGMLHEDGAILGSQSTGGLHLGERAATVFTTLSATFDIAGGQLFAVARGGSTDSSGSPTGLISSLGRFATTSFMAGFVKTGLIHRGDAFGFAISQPLRVESGHIDAVLPTNGRYYSGTISYEATEISLSPTGREIDLEMNYRWQTSGQQFFVSGLLMRDYGHRASMPLAAAALVGWINKF